MKEGRQLDVVLGSATGLKSASKSSVYCVAWIEPSVRVPSPSTKAHGTHPEFNTTITMSMDDRTLGRGQHLIIELLGQGIVSTRRIGFVKVNLSDLLQKSANNSSAHIQFNAHPVTRHSGRQEGFISFDLYLRPTSAATTQSKTPKAAVMSRRMTMEPTPSQPKVVTTLRQRFEVEGGDQSDDVASPLSTVGSEDGNANKAGTRRRSYAIRPRSFSFNGCMSQQQPKEPQPNQQQQQQ